MSYEVGHSPPSGHPPTLSHRLYEALGRCGARRPVARHHRDPLAVETERLAHGVVLYAIEKGSRRPDPTETCLRNCVQKMLEKHSFMFGGMMNRLSMERNEFSKRFTEVADELFKDEISWSKVVALFAFAARLGQHCLEHGMEDLVLEVATCLSNIAIEKINPFVRDQGGWSTLCEVFPVQTDYETQVWRALLVTGLGLASVAALLVIRNLV